MKNELYYSANSSSQPTSSASFSFIKNKFFLFLLLLSMLGGFFYFNPNFIHKLIESTKNKKIVIQEENKELIKEETPSQKNTAKLTQDELQNIANKIVKNLKSIEIEKQSLEKKLIETTAKYENSDTSIEKISNNEEFTLPSTNKKPIVTPSFKPKPHKKEITAIKKENYQEVVPYQEEIVAERVEEVFDDSYIESEFDTIPPQDLLETLSVELNNAVVETSFDSYPEEIPQEIIIDETYIEQESMEQDNMEMSLY